MAFCLDCSVGEERAQAVLNRPAGAQVGRHEKAHQSGLSAKGSDPEVKRLPQQISVQLPAQQIRQFALEESACRRLLQGPQ